MAETIIITGGHGFVGRHLTTALQAMRPAANLIIWDREQTAVDITKPDTYREALIKYQPQWVIHLAALAAVGESYKQPELVEHVNVEGTRQLLQSIQTLSPATKVLVASSADIYGTGTNDFHGQPIPELALEAAQPHNPYARSKWLMEKMIVDSFNDRCIRVRPFPHIGPGQQPGFVTADFAQQIALIEAGQANNLKVGNLEAIRDFTDVRDVVQAYSLLLDKGALGEVYHVASEQGVTIQMIVDQLLQLANVPIQVTADPDRLRPSDTPALVGDATKLKQITGWQPHIPLHQSLQDILNDWRQRVKS